MSKLMKMRWAKIGLGFLLTSLFITAAFATTTGDDGIGKIASNITGSFESIGKLMFAVAYLAGIGFTIAAIFKFKQHKDNPTQIPLGTPIALLVIGVCLIFIASFYEPIGKTFFGDTGGAGGFQGDKALDKIPGVKNGT